MQLDGIGFRGYKAFPGGDNETDELQRLTLAPLTLIFGKNNSGKSAVVRLPRLLLGGLACDDERLLPLEIQGVRYGGRFVDIVHGGAFFRRPTFEILARHGGEQLDLSVTLYSPGALAVDKPPQIWSYKMRKPQEIDLPPPTLGLAPRMPFRGLLPVDDQWDRWREAASALLDEMIHLGPMRAVVKPAYTEEQPERLGLDGGQAPQWLRANHELMDKVGSWFETNMDGWRLSLSQGNESFYLRAGMSRAMATNLAYAGEGLQQVLPVVLHQIWRQETGSATFLDVVEQPELHLHAAAQAPLADLFIDTALQGRGSVLVETHSEPILLRVQRRVAEGVIPPDRVALYFVDVTAGGSQLRSIGLRPNGEVDWWPDGVFEEDFQEVAAMSRAQRRRPGSGERE
ncbi:MAG TPA: AAA family ATPase [Thermoanaerobaculia bacterium]|nr:AAA family ATPase [Thermoanaerobaculia bacterium]